MRNHNCIWPKERLLASMRRTRIALWGIGILLCISVVAAISIPNLLRARISAYAPGYKRGVHLEAQAEGLMDQLALQRPGQVEKKFIMNGDLSLIVADVRKTAEDIRRVVESQKGEIQQMEIAGSRKSSMFAT